MNQRIIPLLYTPDDRLFERPDFRWHHIASGNYLRPEWIIPLFENACCLLKYAKQDATNQHADNWMRIGFSTIWALYENPIVQGDARKYIERRYLGVFP
jgi:hypothetical protein